MGLEFGCQRDRGHRAHNGSAHPERNNYEFFEAHRALLDEAVNACRTRAYWSAFPEIASGKIYGETAKADGEAAFKAMLGKPFDLGQPGGTAGRQGDLALRHGARHHLCSGRCRCDRQCIAESGRGAGRKPSIEDRVGVCLEIVNRINKQSFLMANAVMHTTGQAFMMAFQAGGAHARGPGAGSHRLCL